MVWEHIRTAQSTTIRPFPGCEKAAGLKQQQEQNSPNLGTALCPGGRWEKQGVSFDRRNQGWVQFYLELPPRSRLTPRKRQEVWHREAGTYQCAGGQWLYGIFLLLALAELTALALPPWWWWWCDSPIWGETRGLRLYVRPNLPSWIGQKLSLFLLP